MSLDRTFSIRQIASAVRIAPGRYSMHHASLETQLASHIRACHKFEADPSCPACGEIKAKIKKATKS